MHYISERAIVEETCPIRVNFIEPENSQLMDQIISSFTISIYFAECPFSSTFTLSLSLIPA